MKLRSFIRKKLYPTQTSINNYIPETKPIHPVLPKIDPLFDPLKDEPPNPIQPDEEKENKPIVLLPVVNQLMANVLEKNENDLSVEKIEPFSDELQLGKNGVILFIARQGKGKSYKIMQLILYTDMIAGNKPYFNNILFSSTSDQNDKTVDAFKKVVKTKIEYVPHDEILERLEKHIKHKKKLNALWTYIHSKNTIVTKVMKRLAIKHKLFDQQRTMNYIKHKMMRYGYPQYPTLSLVILDDFLGSPYLERKEHPFVRLITKCRHYQITLVVAQQSVKGIGKTARRMASDCVIWSGFGMDDFIDICKEMSCANVNPKDLYKIYRDLSGHSNLQIHNHNNTIEIEDVP
ncbi:MAG: hypothetical protein LBR40_00155 [Bacilli bacterium]|jgi:hypothetical protein|nr:hypothetical protein [Bacilli bacterium]